MLFGIYTFNLSVYPKYNLTLFPPKYSIPFSTAVSSNLSILLFSEGLPKSSSTFSSVLGSLFRYFEKFSKWENAWEDYVDLCDEERNQVLAAAYKQYMLNRVTEAVKGSLEAYREYNKPWE